jgi:ATP-dependent Zn protease
MTATAYHEAGHVAAYIFQGLKVRKATIISTEQRLATTTSMNWTARTKAIAMGLGG